MSSYRVITSLLACLLLTSWIQGYEAYTPNNKGSSFLQLKAESEDKISDSADSAESASSSSESVLDNLEKFDGLSKHEKKPKGGGDVADDIDLSSKEDEDSKPGKSDKSDSLDLGDPSFNLMGSDFQRQIAELKAKKQETLNKIKELEAEDTSDKGKKLKSTPSSKRPKVDLDLDPPAEDTSGPEEKHHMSPSLRAHLKKIGQLKEEESEDVLTKDPTAELNSFVANLQKITTNSPGAPVSTPSPDSLSTAPIGGGLFNNIHSALVSSVVPSSYQQADKALISVLANKHIFSTLPGEIRNLIRNYENQYELNLNTSQSIDPIIFYDSNNATQSLTSQPFIDPNGKIGRRGFLTLLNRTTMIGENVWLVLNSRVLCIYNSENFVSIKKLIRNPLLKYGDMIATPCFSLYSERDLNEEKVMLCAGSIFEKELWLQAFMIANQKSREMLNGE